MSICLPNLFILQLQAIYNAIKVDNKSNIDFLKKDISLTILPTSQPIGFMNFYKFK